MILVLFQLFRAAIFISEKLSVQFVDVIYLSKVSYDNLMYFFLLTFYNRLCDWSMIITTSSQGNPYLPRILHSQWLHLLT